MNVLFWRLSITSDSLCVADYYRGLCVGCCQCMQHLWWMVKYWDRFFLEVLKFLTGSIILSTFHAHLHRHATVIRRTRKQSLGTFKQRLALLVIGQHITRCAFTLIHVLTVWTTDSLWQTFSLIPSICKRWYERILVPVETNRIIWLSQQFVSAPSKLAYLAPIQCKCHFLTGYFYAFLKFIWFVTGVCKTLCLL